MKGVSAVIAIILILMIVVALAALAYTWFTGIFTSLTATAGTAVTQTTGAMATQFVIEVANCDTSGTYDTVHVTIRNTGTETINGDNLAAYVDNSPVGDNAAGTVASQATLTFDAGTAAGEVDCSSAAQVRITTGTGLAQTATIT